MEQDVKTPEQSGMYRALLVYGYALSVIQRFIHEHRTCPAALFVDAESYLALQRANPLVPHHIGGVPVYETKMPTPSIAAVPRILHIGEEGDDHGSNA